MKTFYTSHSKLPFIGEAGLKLLSNTSVLVIGAGGLGCPVLQILAGCGIGTIGVVDFDVVSISNLHRQFLYSYDDVGKNKVDVAVKKLHAFNPDVHIHVHKKQVNASNILQFVSSYDIVVDCTDNFMVRYLINDACVVTKKPLVYGAIHQGEGHITVFNYNGGPTLRCLFPEEDNESIESCADIGAYNVVTNIIGTMMANEVIKVALAQDDVLNGVLLQYNALQASIKQIKFTVSPRSREISKARFAKNKYQSNIITFKEYSRQYADQKNSIVLLDVRTNEERVVKNIGGEHIPLDELFDKQSFSFKPTNTIVVYCEKGIRSLQAVEYLRTKGFDNAYSLENGLLDVDE